MIITFAPWVVTLWRRSWLVIFLALVVTRAYVQVPAGEWTLDKLTGAAVAFTFFAAIVWILDNNARAFETIRKAFARIIVADEERLARMIGLRLATESLAATLDVIREDLASNTAATHASAKAASDAVTMAESAAEAINMRLALIEKLDATLTAVPLPAAVISLQRIDANTAATERNTTTMAADLQTLKDAAAAALLPKA